MALQSYDWTKSKQELDGGLDCPASASLMLSLFVNEAGEKSDSLSEIPVDLDMRATPQVLKVSKEHVSTHSRI